MDATYDISEERELIERAKAGDVASFERLVYRHDRQVLSIAASYVDCADDAKDVYQETIWRVYKGLPKFRGEAAFSTWLFRVATNVCLTHVKKKKRRRAVSLDERRDDDERRDVDPEATTPAPDREAVDREIGAEIEQALAELSPRQRLTFTMKHYEGYKIREIAEKTGISEGAVKGYLFEATRRLRRRLAHLKDYLEDAE